MVYFLQTFAKRESPMGQAMDDGEKAVTRGPLGRWSLWAAVLLGLCFVANVAVGKVAFLRGATSHPGLGDVGEFILLFIAVFFFIVACLTREPAAAGESRTKSRE